MVKTILLPTDGSGNSRRAVEQTVGLAEDLNAEIHGLSIAGEYASEQRQDQLRSDPEDQAQQALVEAKEVFDRADVDFVSTIREGTPHKQILDYARTNDIDMIIMGTHGRTGLKRALIGSVAEKTVRNSPVPVMMVPPEE